MVKEKQGGSLNPSTFTEGGALVGSDAPIAATWKEVRIVKGYRDGKTPSATTMRIVMDADVGGDEPLVDHEEYYSAGAQCEPNAEGTGIVEGGSITKSTKVASLLESLDKAGFPMDKVGNDSTVFEGLECTMVREKVPERKGITRTPRADGKVYGETILLVDRITKMPWEKKRAKGETASSGKASDNDLTDKAQNIVMGILEKNAKGLDKKKMANAVFNALKEDPDRNAIVKMVYDEEFLSNGPWSYEKGVVGG